MMSPSIVFRCATTTASLSVLSLSGEEALSRPYRFEIDLASDDPALPLDSMVGAPASIEIAGRTMHGIIAEVDQGEALGGDVYAYHVALAPRLALLGVAKQTRMFHGLSTPDLVLAAIAASGLALDVELRLERVYPPRAHTVQYQESALDFVSRLLEQAGVGYFFEHDGAAERLVLSDHEGAYRAETAASMGEGVRALRCRKRISPKGLVLIDYNDRTPDVPLQAEVDVDARGFGVQIDAADPFSTPEEGAALAALRAEEMRCRATVFDGSSVAPLAAGARLDLTGHFRGDFNQGYLLTRVSHRAENGSYTCAFEAIPATQPFRPARATPKPRLGGAMVAHIDAAGPEGTAAVDAEGRYRVVMPFDLSGAAEAQASMPMRMATPYGGADEGMQFTLRKGAEVLWTGVDGDPERPVITGVVPNAKSRVVPSADGVASRIRLPNGAMFEMGSGAGKKGRSRSAVSTDGALPREQQLGQETDNPYESSSGTGTSGAEDWMRIAVPHSDGKNSYLRYGEKASTAAGSFTESGGLAPSGGYNGWEWSNLDTGYDMSLADADKGSNAHFGWNDSDGVYDYTDGNRTVITRGDLQSVTEGDRTDVVLGNYRLVIPNRTLGIFDADAYAMNFYKSLGGWSKVEACHVSSLKASYGDTENFFTGTNLSANLGGNFGFTAGVNGSLFLGLDLSVKAGMSFSYATGSVFEFGNSRKITTAESQDIKGRSQVHLRVRPDPGGHAIALAAKLTAGGIAAGLGTGMLAVGSAAFGNTAHLAGGVGPAVIWAGVTAAALAGAAVVNRAAHAHAGAPNASELILDLTKSTLRAGGPLGPSVVVEQLPVPKITLQVAAAGPSITLDATSITLSCGPAGPSIKLDAANGVVLKGGPLTRLAVGPQDVVGQVTMGHHFFQLDAIGFISG